MTDPRIEAAARALYEANVGLTWPNDADDETMEYYYGDARIALAAADAAAWRPIATAPKDGTQIVLFRPKTDTSTQRITAGAWYEPAPVLNHMCPDICGDDMPEPHWETWDGGFLVNNPQPTHWHPLPAPPNTEASPAPETITIPEVRNDRPIPVKGESHS